jgi:hypothetical protein
MSFAKWAPLKLTITALPLFHPGSWREIIP